MRVAVFVAAGVTGVTVTVPSPEVGVGVGVSTTTLLVAVEVGVMISPTTTSPLTQLVLTAPPRSEGHEKLRLLAVLGHERFPAST